MKKFFGGVFINKETLKNAGIKHPIKLEYYKRINMETFTELDKAKYGVSIIKTEYYNDKTKVEEKDIKYVTNDEKRIEFLLQTLKENFVTPIGLEDVIYDFVKQIL